MENRTITEIAVSEINEMSDEILKAVGIERETLIRYRDVYVKNIKYFAECDKVTVEIEKTMIGNVEYLRAKIKEK